MKTQVCVKCDQCHTYTPEDGLYLVVEWTIISKQGKTQTTDRITRPGHPIVFCGYLCMSRYLLGE